MKNYILSIGIGQYKNQGEDILSLGQVPVNDCTRLAGVLHGDLYGFEDVREPLFNEQASCNAILSALDRLRDIEEDSQLIVLFSGHGHYNSESNMSYWLTHEAVTPSDFDLRVEPEKQGWLSAKSVVQKINDAGSRHVLILADCCFSGHMLYNFRGIGGAIYPDYAKLAIRKNSREIITPCGITSVLSAVGDRHVSKFIERVSCRLESKPVYEVLCPQEIFSGLYGVLGTTPLYGHLQDGSEHGGCFLFSSPAQLGEIENEPFENEDLLHHVLCKKLQKKLRPIRSGIDRKRYLKDFIGRQWLFDQIDEWIRTGTSKLFWLTAEPGVGKSAIAAYLVDHHALIHAHHFFLFEKTSTLKLKEVAKSLAYQLSCVFPQYAEYIDGLDEQHLAGLDEQSFFDELIILPLAEKISRPAAPVVILLDGVDEVTRGRNPVAEYVAKLLRGTDDWLRIILTSRPRDSKINIPLSKFEPVPLSAEDPRNRDDLAAYLEVHLPDQLRLQSVINVILDKSEGNFLYVVHLCDDILPESESLDVDALPRGLNGLYELFFYRKFPDPTDYKREAVPFIHHLVAAYEPLSLEQYRCYLKESERNLIALIQKFGSLLKAESNGAVFFHKSLYDWITSSCESEFFISLIEAKNQIAGSLWLSYTDSEKGFSDYELSYLPMHLSESKYSAKTIQVASDLKFLELKCFYKGIRAVCSDLSLVNEEVCDETLRRCVVANIKNGIDKYYWFLQKKPQGFISCVLNHIKLVTNKSEFQSVAEILNVEQFSWIHSSHQKSDEAARSLFVSGEGEIRSCYPDSENHRLLIKLEEGLVVLDLDTNEWVEFVIEPDLDFGFGSDDLEELLDSDHLENEEDDPEFGEYEDRPLSDDWFADDEYILPEVAIDHDSPDYIYCVVWGGLWRIDVRQNKKRQVRLPFPAFTVFSHPAIQGLLVGCCDGHICLLNYETNEVEKRIRVHDCGMTNITYHDETGLLVTSGADGSVRLWRLDDFSCVHTLEGHYEPVCRIISLGSQLLSVAEDLQAIVWDAASGARLGCLCVNSADSFFSSEADGIEENCLKESEGSLNEVPSSISVRRNGEIFLTYPSGNIQVWENGQLALDKKICSEKLVHASVLEPTEDLVYSSVKEVGLLPYSKFVKWEPEVPDEILEVVFSAVDDEFLLVSERNLTLYSDDAVKPVLDIPVDGRPAQTFINEPAGCVVSLIEMADDEDDEDDEELFFKDPFDYEVSWKLQFWDKGTGKAVREYEKTVLSRGNIFDGTCILFAHDCCVILYDLESREEIFSQPVEDARCVTFSSDGTCIYVGRNDNTVQIFCRDSLELVATLSPEPGMFGFSVDIYDMVASEDDHHLLVEYKSIIPGSTMIYNVIYDLEKGHAVFLSAGDISLELKVDFLKEKWTNVFPQSNCQTIVWQLVEKRLVRIPSSLDEQSPEYNVTIADGSFKILGDKRSQLDSLPVGGTKIVKNPRASEWIVFGSGSQPFTKIKLENGSRLGDRRSLSLNTFFSGRGDSPVNIDRSWDNFCRILSGSNWEEQREAIKALIGSDLLIPADNLLRLYKLKEEMGHEVEEVEELILEKGDAELSELYMSIMKPSLRKRLSVDGERFLRKICSVSDIDTIAEAVEYALENGAYHELAQSLSFIAKAGLNKQCVTVVEWCLSNDKDETQALLCTGVLPDFDEDRISSYLNHANLQLRAAALRALESRHRNGRYLEKIKVGCKSIIQNFEGDQVAWDALEFVDGILEFGGKAQAISALKQIYEKISEEHVFPRRATWERLRVLNEEPYHEVFSGLPRIRPYPWPTKEEPFFGIC